MVNKLKKVNGKQSNNGQFEVVGHIASGVFKQTIKVLDTVDRKHCALKIIVPRKNESIEVVDAEIFSCLNIDNEAGYKCSLEILINKSFKILSADFNKRHLPKIHLNLFSQVPTVLATVLKFLLGLSISTKRV